MSGFAAMAAERDGLYARLASACRTVLRREHQSGPPEVPLWTMPLDHESTDEEITAVMTQHEGSEIVWANSISGRQQNAVLVRFRSVSRRGPGYDFVNVICDDGYRSIYLHQIVSIG